MTEIPFFHDVEPVRRVRDEVMDVHHPAGSHAGPRPAVIFVHGGPVPEDLEPRPRDWAGFIGYGALVAASGLVGITFNHRLHSDELYPEASDDVAAVVERVRELDAVDSDRIALWFFSGGGPIGAAWLRAAPSWLRAVGFTYPVLAPPPDWPGDAPRFNTVEAVSEHPELPKLLVRVGKDFEFFVPTQDAFVQEARSADADLEVIEIPDAAHGFEDHGAEPEAREAVDRAVSWFVKKLNG